MSGPPPIAITGLGAVCSVGADVPSLLDSIRRGASGLRTLSRFDPGAIPAVPVGEVASLPGNTSEGSATHRLACAAAREAVRDAGFERTPAPERIAVVVGTTTGGIERSGDWYLRRLDGHSPDAAELRRHALGTVGTAVAAAVGATGPILTLCTACSSGANAIAVGADLLRAGEADLVLAGGADGLCRMTYFGFFSLQLLSPRPCMPFDVARDGLSLGEAGAMLALERPDDARRRGRQPHAWLTGSACTCDAHHATAPAPDGRAMAAAVTQAIAQGALLVDDVGYINAHGTGTRANDAVEASVLRQVFGERGPPVSASKSFLGHTLGAAGAIEALITVLAIREGLLPPTLGAREPDAGAPADLVLGAARIADVRHALSVSFGFGGNNAALLFSRVAS